MTTARCEVWFTFMVAEVAVEVCEMDTAPAATTPPDGNAFTAGDVADCE